MMAVYLESKHDRWDPGPEDSSQSLTFRKIHRQVMDALRACDNLHLQLLQPHERRFDLLRSAESKAQFLGKVRDYLLGGGRMSAGARVYEMLQTSETSEPFREILLKDTIAYQPTPDELKQERKAIADREVVLKEDRMAKRSALARGAFGGGPIAGSVAASKNRYESSLERLGGGSRARGSAGGLGSSASSWRGGGFSAGPFAGPISLSGVLFPAVARGPELSSEPDQDPERTRKPEKTLEGWLQLNGGPDATHISTDALASTLLETSHPRLHLKQAWRPFVSFSVFKPGKPQPKPFISHGELAAGAAAAAGALAPTFSVAELLNLAARRQAQLRYLFRDLEGDLRDIMANKLVKDGRVLVFQYDFRLACIAHDFMRLAPAGEAASIVQPVASEATDALASAEDGSCWSDRRHLGFTSLLLLPGRRLILELPLETHTLMTAYMLALDVRIHNEVRLHDEHGDDSTPSAPKGAEITFCDGLKLIWQADGSVKLEHEDTRATEDEAGPSLAKNPPTLIPMTWHRVVVVVTQAPSESGQALTLAQVHIDGRDVYLTGLRYKRNETKGLLSEDLTWEWTPCECSALGMALNIRWLQLRSLPDSALNDAAKTVRDSEVNEGELADVPLHLKSLQPSARRELVLAELVPSEEARPLWQSALFLCQLGGPLLSEAVQDHLFKPLLKRGALVQCKEAYIMMDRMLSGVRDCMAMHPEVGEGLISQLLKAVDVISRSVKDARPLWDHFDGFCNARAERRAKGLRALVNHARRHLEAHDGSGFSLLPAAYKMQHGGLVHFVLIVQGESVEQDHPTFRVSLCANGICPSQENKRYASEYKVKLRSSLVLSSVRRDRLFDEAFLTMLYGCLDQDPRGGSDTQSFFHEALLPWLVEKPELDLHTDQDTYGCPPRTPSRGYYAALASSYFSLREAVRHMILQQGLPPAATKLVTSLLRQSLAGMAAADLEAVGAISALEMHVWRAALRRVSVAAVKAADAMKLAGFPGLNEYILTSTKRLVERWGGQLDSMPKMQEVDAARADLSGFSLTGTSQEEKADTDAQDQDAATSRAGRYAKMGVLHPYFDRVQLAPLDLGVTRQSEVSVASLNFSLASISVNHPADVAILLDDTEQRCLQLESLQQRDPMSVAASLKFALLQEVFLSKLPIPPARATSLSVWNNPVPGRDSSEAWPLYGEQLDLLLNVSRLTQHFIAAFRSQPVTRGSLAIALAVLGVAAAMADFVARQRSTNKQSLMASVLEPGEGDADDRYAPVVGEDYVQLFETLDVVSPEVNGARAAVYDYFDSVQQQPMHGSSDVQWRAKPVFDWRRRKSSGGSDAAEHSGVASHQALNMLFGDADGAFARAICRAGSHVPDESSLHRLYMDSKNCEEVRMAVGCTPIIHALRMSGHALLTQV